jgi:hypothetical protein
MRDKLASLLSAATHIVHINTFQLMIINRCIDFTKVANGVQLLPRLETVRVSEVLALPLTCMRGTCRVA